MGIHTTFRVRSLSLLVGGLALALVFAIPFAAQQSPANPPASPVAPLKPDLPDGAFVDGRLIPLPANVPTSGRGRRAAASIPQLTEDQKILHLLNRAGFGPRPGDIERVRRMGIQQYIEEQLHPEGLSDDFLSRPLLALSTLQMSQFEILQTYEPPPVRPQPTPTPTPTPTPAAKPSPAPDVEPDKVEKTNPGESMQPQSQQQTQQRQMTPQQSSTQPQTPQQPATPQQTTPQQPSTPPQT